LDPEIDLEIDLADLEFWVFSDKVGPEIDLEIDLTDLEFQVF